MKKILLSAFVWLLCAWPLTGSDYHKGGTNKPLAYYVIAADAPAHMRVGGEGRYLCDGTADNVQIQAALDAAADRDDDGWAIGDGAIVRLSPGCFYLAAPAGETVWSGTADTSTVGSATVLTVNGWTGTDAITDVRVGELVRIYDDGDAGTDPADNNDDQVLTVIAKTASPDTITLHAELTTNYSGGNDDIGFKRLVGCISQPTGTQLVGSGIITTRLAPTTATDATAIVVEGYGTGAGAIRGRSWMGLADLSIRTETNPKAFDGDRNGVVLSAGIAEYELRSVAIWYIPGDALVCNTGHGVRFYGNSTVEAVYGRAIVLNHGFHFQCSAVKISNNKRDGILLHRSTDCGIQARFALGDTGVYAIRGFTAIRNTIYGSQCVILDADPAGGMIFGGGSAYNAITGNVIQSTTFDDDVGIVLNQTSIYNAITGNAIYLGGDNTVGMNISSYGNSISGNVLRVTSPGTGGVPFTRGTFFGGNTVTSNNGARRSDEVLSAMMTNKSGSDITAYYLVQRPTGYTTDGDEIEVATAAGIARCLGPSAIGAIVDDATGQVQLCGFNSYCPINSAEAGGQAVAVGDLLTVSGSVNGTLIEAASTNTVVAIAMEAQTGAAGVVMKDVIILPAEERFAAP